MQQNLNTHDSRIGSVDVMRGIVMSLMALDHTRDYLVIGDPTDLEATTVPLFLTRWVTHFCAPAFVLLAGVSAFLVRERHQLSRSSMAHRLAVRGLWLIVLDIVVLPFLWWFNFDYSLLPLGVLWAIGWSMIALAAVIFLDHRWIAAIGVSMILAHNCTDNVRFASGGLLDRLWCVLHVQTAIQPIDGFRIITAYPLVPWIGVLFVGYALGETLVQPLHVRRKRLMLIGATLIGAFLLIRGINVYGDPSPWVWQDNFAFTELSFLNCTKYPPSLAFLLMTLGPILLILGLLGEQQKWWKTPLTILGRAPLFFYLLHIAVIHVVAIGLSVWKYGRADWWFNNPPFAGIPDDYGWSLPVLYAVWLIVVASLIPVCLAYTNHVSKAGRHSRPHPGAKL